MHRNPPTASNASAIHARALAPVTAWSTYPTTDVAIAGFKIHTQRPTEASP